MFVVELEGLKVRFGFEHELPGYRGELDDEVYWEPGSTECTVETTTYSADEVNVDNYYGYSQCHEVDQFSKDQGRKWALRRALAMAFPSLTDCYETEVDPTTTDVVYNQYVRKVVWLRYHNRGLNNKQFAAMLKGGE